MTVRLSVHDLLWPGHLPELLPALESLGYHRYWASEHHSTTQSASPTIIAALAAGLTERMRVGTAGVLLKLSSALRVATDFAALEMFYPGRIDLGIAGGMAHVRYQRQLAKDLIIADDATYQDRVRRLAALVRGTMTDEVGPLLVGPESSTTPELWLCGAGVGSARLAASLGMRYAYAHYMANEQQDNRVASEIGDAYRAAFVAHAPGDRPYFAIAGYGACMPTMKEAEAEWWMEYEGTKRRQPTFLGTPEVCAESLRKMAASYAADEVLLDCFTSSYETRMFGLEALARTFR